MSATDIYGTVVQQFYVAYFGRPADPAAVPRFAAALAADDAPTTLADLTSAYYTSDTIRALVDDFGNSHESATLYGAVSNDAAHAAGFVTAIYNNLFNRAPASAGLDYWVAALLDGSLSPGDAALTIAAAAAANTSAQGMLDAHAVANKTAAAALFTADLASPAYADAYAGVASAAVARAMLAGMDAAIAPADHAATIQQAADAIVQLHSAVPPNPLPVSLTSGADTLAASHFSGVLSSLPGASTLNSGDILLGSDGYRLLSVQSDGSDFPTGVTLQHIASIEVEANGDVGNIDISGDADLGSLLIVLYNERASHDSVVKAAGNTTVGIIGVSDPSGTAAVDHVTALSVSGYIFADDYDNVSATSVQGDVDLSSSSTTGVALLSGTSTSGLVSISAPGAATSGIYNLYAASATSSFGIIVGVAGGIGSELYNITLGAHASPASLMLSSIGVGAQATAGSYAANTVIDGASGGDVLVLAHLAANSETRLGDQTRSGTLNDALAHAHAVSSAGALQSFTYAGNTYLVEDQVAGVAAANSSVIELIGIHTIASASGAGLSETLVTLAT